MFAGGHECSGVAPFPTDVASSEHYRNLFNQEARKLGYPITWVKDEGLPNEKVPARFLTESAHPLLLMKKI